MNKSIVLALIASAATLAAVAAHAGGVAWSVGINLPVPRVVLPVLPAFVSAPVPVVAAEPVYASEPMPVYYRRAPVYVRSLQVVYPRYYPAWRHPDDHDRWEGRGWRRD
jgi:hypothetical protein